jgi:hypothetical protein
MMQGMRLSEQIIHERLGASITQRTPRANLPFLLLVTERRPGKLKGEGWQAVVIL